MPQVQEKQTPLGWIHSPVAQVDYIDDMGCFIILADGAWTVASGRTLGNLKPVVGMVGSHYGKLDIEDGGFEDYAFVLGERMLYDYRAKYLPDARKG